MKTSVFEEVKHGVYTANCQDNVMPEKKLKSSATLPADSKGLMSMGAVNWGVNAASNPPEAGGQPMWGQPLGLPQNEEPSTDCQWG